jgi:hypothetical protein
VSTVGIDKQRTSPYRPAANGQAERQHRTINAMLGKIVSKNQTDWDARLPFVMAAYRASPHEVTGYTPNFLMYGREHRAPIDLVHGRPSPGNQDNNYSDYTLMLADKMDNAYRDVRQSLKVAANRMKHTHELRVRPARFAPRDRVLYYTPRRYKGRSPKWTRCYTGPYEVVQQIGPVSYLIRKSARAKPLVVHTDKLRLYYGDTEEVGGEALAVEDPLAVAPSAGTERPQRDRLVPRRFLE